MSANDATRGMAAVESMARVLWEFDGYEDSRMWDEFGPHYLDKAAAILASRPFAQRDAHIKAEALREAANIAISEDRGIPWDHDYDRATVAAWLGELADRIEGRA